MEQCSATQPRILLGFSKYIFGLLLLIYTGAAMSLWLSSAWLLIKIILTALLLIHGTIIIRRDVLLIAPRSIIGLEHDGHHWHLYKKSGETHLARLSQGSIRMPYFLLLHFQDLLNRERYFVLVFPDTLPTDSFRLLKATIAILHSP